MDLLEMVERYKIAVEVFLKYIPDNDKIAALAEAAYLIRTEIVETEIEPKGIYYND